MMLPAEGVQEIRNRQSLDAFIPMHEAVPEIVALIGAGAAAACLALFFWLFVNAYAEMDQRDPNSWWFVISRRYRRTLNLVIYLYVVAGLALVSSTILENYLQ